MRDSSSSGAKPVLNVFTCANRPYEDFVPLFVSAMLWSNPEAFVEIGLEDLNELSKTPLLDAMTDVFGDRYLLRPVPWRTEKGRKILPNSVRFVNEPEVKADYVYISDIDIVTLRSGIVGKHVSHMASTGLPFSNWIRTDTTRLTGLHFARFDFQYPLPDVSDLLSQRMNDEVLLYHLVERKLGHAPTVPDRFRPVHGIHISPNRAPGGEIKNGVRRPGWGINLHWEIWSRFRHSDHLLAVLPHMSERMVWCVEQIDGLVAKRGSAIETKADADA
jgi:hypothetical protein